MPSTDAKQRFLEALGRPWMADEMFDAIPDCLFFIKDREGRYVAVNQTLVTRCGRKTKEELIGKTAREVYPPPLGENFTEQDFEVIRKGRAILGQLELHLYPDGSRGWCLTWKEPVTSAANEIIGVSGMSRDISLTAEAARDLGPISDLLDHIDTHLGEPLRVQELAARTGLSAYQLDQRIRVLFDLTTAQYITRKRIELACHLLDWSSESITGIALDCGYGDQSAFTRQFRQSVGLTPGAFRDRKKSPRPRPSRKS